MLTDGLRVAKYSNTLTNLLDTSPHRPSPTANDSAPRTPPRRTTEQTSWRKCTSMPAIGSQISPKKSSTAHWTAGSTIKVGLNLAEAASLVRYPGLNGLKPSTRARSGLRAAIARGASNTLSAIERRPPLLLEDKPDCDDFPIRASPLPSLVSREPISPSTSPRRRRPPRDIAAVAEGAFLPEARSPVRTEIESLCNRRLMAVCPRICLSAESSNEEASTRTFSVPCAVAFISGTISHISRSCTSFREHQTGVIVFSSLLPEVLEELVDYLYWAWFKADSMQSDFAAHSAGLFQPRLTLLFDLMEAAVYFDLSDLVEICATTVAANFDAVVSFGQLLPPLIKQVLARLSIGDLCICEYDHWRAEQSMHADDRVQVDTAKFWLRAHAKVQDRFPIAPSRLPLLKSSEVHHARVRALCIRFYVEECLRRELTEGAKERLARIVQREQLTELCIVVTSATTRHQIDFWISLMKILHRRPTIHITVEGLSPATVDPFVNFCAANVPLNLCFKCFDTVHLSTMNIMQSLPERTTSLPPAQPLSSPHGATRPFAALSTGWDPVRPGATSLKNHAEFSNPHDPLSTRHIGLTISYAKWGLSWQATTSVIDLLALANVTGLVLSGMALAFESHGILAAKVASATCTIQKLNLAHCNLRAAGIQQLAAALRTNCSIKHLNIAFNIPYDDFEAPDAARALASTLSQQPGPTALQELVLAGNNLTTAGVISLCEAIGKRTRVAHLDFSDMDLNASLKHLGRALVAPGRLDSRTGAAVDISGTRILPRTFADFCAVLTAAATAAPQQEQLACIAELDISRVQVNHDFAISLCTLLVPESHVALTKLVLAGADDDPDCALGDVGCEMLLDALKRNVTLRHLDLSVQRLSDATYAHLAACFEINVTLEEIAETLWPVGGFILLAGPQRNINT
ncbi:hypothetical protein BDZ88DRAFT_483255 [Geranomyces variabilis]|nr:hypothetical protein BDZ88DRAFT_483255 [Geranomyces variabilis]